VLEVTIRAANRLHHRRTATMQMDEEIYLPLHRLRRAVAVVKLHSEFPLRGCDGETSLTGVPRCLSPTSWSLYRRAT
jgi:hypothetical protein